MPSVWKKEAQTVLSIGCPPELCELELFESLRMLRPASGSGRGLPVVDRR
jgi:hypothetical protein